MKKIFAFSLIAALFIFPVLQTAAFAQVTQPVKEVRKIKIGVDSAYPPFSQIADGKPVGFDIDIAHALCEQMKAECTFVQLDFDSMIPALHDKRIDAVIASMSITDEREKVVAFSDKYHRTPARFVVRKASGLTVSAAGLKGKRIGVARGTAHDRFAADTFKESTIVRFAKPDEIFVELAAGRIDGAFMDGVAASEGFLKKPLGKDFELLGPNFIDPLVFGAGAGITLRKGEASLRNAFNTAIKSIQSNGIYKKIQNKYFDFDISGTCASGSDCGAATKAPTVR
ncbi:MAG: transporter substrate-binding domain-containing protein [Betaproteobacteria bacterium]|nr:transporter substrate-binding domain-containing protein [Betaproteobacteria bacterium]